MMIIKIKTLLLFFAALLCFSSASSASECKNALNELNVKPPELQFMNCKKVERAPATLLESEYSVTGEHAKAVEDFLHKEFGLKRLRFVCCGWETREATYISKTGETYAVNMYSYDEFNSQVKWSDYKEFRVRIGKYLILP